MEFSRYCLVYTFSMKFNRHPLNSFEDGTYIKTDDRQDLCVINLHHARITMKA
jgi:hypothetical protein